MLQLGDLSLLGDALLLGQDLELALFLLALEQIEAVDGTLHRLEVGEHAAEPTVRYVKLLRGTGCFRHDVRGLSLGTDEQDLLAASDRIDHEVAGSRQLNGRLLQIDDVDAVLLAEDVGLHLRVPPTGLVTEVDAGVEQISQGNIRHVFSSPVKPPRLPRDHRLDQGPNSPSWSGHRKGRKAREYLCLRAGQAARLREDAGI